MEKKELKIILEAQLPKSYQPTKASVNDEQQESSKTEVQPESSKTAAQQGAQPFSLQKTSTSPSPAQNTHNHSTESSKPTPRQGCASPEYEALFVEWPFKAPSRGQTSMPPVITSLIKNLPTKEERIIAMQLWNRSLPISANISIIEYNRVDGLKFKEKVGEKYGEGWWMRLEDLATGLNEAAGVIVGESTSGEVVKGKGKELEGKALDEGATKEKEPEMKAFGSSTGKGKQSETKTLDQLAEAATLVETEEGSKAKAAKSTIEEGQETQTNPNDEATSAAMSLLSLTSTTASNPPASPSFLATTNPLSTLWYLIDRFFTCGPSAASYFFVALEAAIRLDKTVIHPLHIPAPPAFWTDAADWRVPKVGMALILTLAASEKNMFDAFARFSKSLGKPALKAEEMRRKNSASLRKAVIRAKDDASNKERTTILGVELRDVQYGQLCEVHGKGGIEEKFATFARMFVLGVCPGGAKLWLVGGSWGETGTVWESNGKVGATVGTWEEMDEFVRAFEGFAVQNVDLPSPSPPFPFYLMNGKSLTGMYEKGQWNSKRFKWYHRCFAVDLKQFDLQIDSEEKKKRGIEKRGEGAKRLLNEIEAWVSIYKIEDVKRGDVGKFKWL